MKSTLFAVLAAVALSLAPAALAADLAIAEATARDDGILDVGSIVMTGGTMPTPYTGYGRGAAPDAYWTGGPQGTQSYVVLLEDADAQAAGAPFVHWSLFNLPEAVTSVPEDEAWDTDPPGMKTGANSAGSVDYLPPKPAAGAVHHYHLQVFALDTTLTLPEGASRAALVAAMKGHVIASGDSVATFQAP